MEWQQGFERCSPELGPAVFLVEKDLEKMVANP